MPTYKCQRCGNEIILSIKPGQCVICGASQFRISSPGNSKPSSGNLDQNPSNSSSASTSNTKNRLRIVCKNNLIFGMINGKRVGSFRDQSFTSGKVAVFSMRDKGEATTVYFENALTKEKWKK